VKLSGKKRVEGFFAAICRSLICEAARLRAEAEPGQGYAERWEGRDRETPMATPLAGRAFVAGLAATILIVGCVLAQADQKDTRLPGLFDALKKASSSDEAGAIEAKIWTIWLQANDPAIDKLMAQGSDAMSNQDYAAAMQSFNEIIEKKPDFAEGWNKRATLYYLMGDYEHSLKDIDQTLELEPRHIGALSGLGLVNMQLDHDEAAADAFKRVLDIDPQSASARTNLAIVNDLLKRKSI
jgi:tetratricopeptide (TPR) repeat protein